MTPTVLGTAAGDVVDLVVRAAPAVLLAFDLAGTFVFGLSGALLAVERRLDVVGIAALAVATASGGGVVRDLLIGDVPPVLLRDGRYLGAALLAGAAVFAGHGLVRRLRRGVALADALGLGLFAATGATKALEVGLGALPAALIGVVTAAGGGVVRDVLAREIPLVFRPQGELYALAAASGAGVVVGLATLGVPDSIAAVAGATVGTTVRLLAMRFGWRAPQTVRRRPPRGEEHVR